MNSKLLAVLGLLHGGILLQDHSIHCAAQRVFSSRGECVHNRRWSHCMLLLPRLRHPSNSQLSGDEGGFSAELKRVDVF